MSRSDRRGVIASRRIGGVAAGAFALTLAISPADSVFLGATGSGGLAAQETAPSLARRVEASGGETEFRIALRDGVEVCENGVRMDARDRWIHRDGEGPGVCSTGSARVVLRVAGGRVEDLDLRPDRGDAAAGSSLGDVTSPDAAAFLVGLADGGSVPAARDAARTALMAAGLLAGIEVWPRLLEIARDRDVDGEVRRSALFWVSQAAAERVTEGLQEVAGDEDEDQEVRDAAVFALSRRPSDEAVPALMEVVRTAGQARTRRTALFWLAEQGTPEVTRFFEEILTGG